MPLAFRYAARSDVGLVRSENQDSGYAGPHLLVVADGMGGHAGGDIASSTAIGYLVELDDDAPSSNESGDDLASAIDAANAELGRIAVASPELKGMGTTVTALLRGDNKLALAHIGDSRAYLLRDGVFAQMTTDHSFVQTLIDQGRITPEEAAVHPQRSLVTRVLTGSAKDHPDMGAREARVGDRYLLCSDGLAGFVAGDTIAELLQAGETPDETADRLVDLALKAGAPDNVTVIVADVVDVTRSTPPPSTPQIVGAARLSPAGTRALRSTPAAKAAALRDALGLDEESERVEKLALAEEGLASRRGRLFRLVGAVLVAVIVIAGGSYAAYGWSQRQYFIGISDGRVAVYQGVPQDLGPFSLSSPLEVTDIAVTDLPDYYRANVAERFAVDDLTAAEARVVDLRRQATACASLKARGQTCGVDVSPSTSTSSSSSTGSTSSTSSSTSTTGTSP